MRIHGLSGARLVAADEVQQAAAVLRQRAVDDAAERRVVRRADVLEHADRDERIVVAAHVAVVVLDELDAIGEPFVSAPAPRVGDLLGRDVERAHRHAVVPAP